MTALRLLAAGIALVAASTATYADSLTYRNDRFGTQVTFPAEYFPNRDEPPTNSDGMRFTDPDGGSLAIFGSFNIENETPKQFLKRSLGERRITYSRAGQDWVVVSGHETQDGREFVFYERYLFTKDGIVHGVRLAYPAMQSGKYDRMAGPIANSLSAQ